VSIFRRPNSRYWQIDVRVPGAKPVRQSSGTDDKQLAQRLHDEIKAQLWREAKLGERPRYTWDEAAERYSAETTEKRSYDDEQLKLGKLKPHLSGLFLDQITGAVARDVVSKLPDLKPSSQNRYLALIRAVLRKAHREWEWTDKVPAIKLYREPDPRVRWITREDADRLIAALPSHLKSPAELALQTGLRQANVFLLRWSHVNMATRAIYIPKRESKSNYAIHAPLNDTALAIIHRQPRDHERVFLYQGEPFTKICTRTWNRACKAAGIEDFHWHDLRHTWASWHVQAGTSLQALMELGGWHDYGMVLRYAHLAPSHLSDSAAALPQPGKPKLKVVG
jgi:integrase